MSVISRLVVGQLPTGVMLANVAARQVDVGNVLVSEQSSIIALTASAIASSAAGFDQSDAVLANFIPLWLNTWVLDNGLSGLVADCDYIYVCSQQPFTFTDATVTYPLGNYHFGVGAAFGADSSYAGGMQTSSNVITTGTVTGNGTVAAWAAVDSVNSRLLASGPLTGSVSVSNGQVFGLTSLTIQMPHN